MPGYYAVDLGLLREATPVSRISTSSSRKKTKTKRQKSVDDKDFSLHNTIILFQLSYTVPNPRLVVIVLVTQTFVANNTGSSSPETSPQVPGSWSVQLGLTGGACWSVAWTLLSSGFWSSSGLVYEGTICCVLCTI